MLRMSLNHYDIYFTTCLMYSVSFPSDKQKKTYNSRPKLGLSIKVQTIWSPDIELIQLKWLS